MNSSTAGGLVGPLSFSMGAISDRGGSGVADALAGAHYDVDDGGIDRGAARVPLLAADGAVTAKQKISAGILMSSLHNDARFGIAGSAMAFHEGDSVSRASVGVRGGDKRGADRGAKYVLLPTADGYVQAERQDTSAAGGWAT